MQVGKYFTLEDFCICTNTYQKYAQQINCYPTNLNAAIVALQALSQFILEPIIDCFGKDKFQLTYGFCSPELKKYLNKKDPVTGVKNGRIDPERDQHMAYEVKKNGKYYCERLGAACDFLIVDVKSDRIIDWILRSHLPFDSIYFYGTDRPIHISYGLEHKRDIWTFTPTGTPTRKGIEHWLALAKY